MLVQTRKDFDQFMQVFLHSDVIVVDTETNGLHPFLNDRMIGMSLYFPDHNMSFYLPFRHGEGVIETSGDFDKLSWSTNAKKEHNLVWYWDKYPKNYSNLPLEWMDEIKPEWGNKTLIMYNALFDLAVFYADGFPEPANVEDVMVGVHLVEQWDSVQVDAPFQWTATDAKKAKCASTQVGMWARGDDGQLLKKKQYGNKRLKWITAMLGIERATFGEEELHAEAKAFAKRLCAAVPETKEHPHKYVAINEKSNMWMLPPQSVFTYAINDVILTWELRKWVLSTLEAWDNLELYYTMQKTLLAAWRMERDGVLLDKVMAKEQIALLTPRIEELGAVIGANPNSPKELLPYLNEQLAVDWSDTLPAWFGAEERRDLRLYEGVELTSTDADSLERVGDHALVRMVRVYRKMTKTVRTYLMKWLESADANDRVHPHFETTGTTTGRWSSSGDFGNGQNIPDRGGYTIKRAIIPDPDHLMVAWDYGQLELRLGTWIAEGLRGFGNHEMTDLFLSGADMHAHARDRIGVREIVFGQMTDDEVMLKLGYTTFENKEKIILNECRQIAKTLNFGLLYSGTGAMVSRLLKVDRSVGDTLYHEWNALFPAFRQVNAYYERQALTPRKRPDGARIGMYVSQPISGRRKKYDKIATWGLYKDDEGVTRSYNPQQAEARKAFNFVVQGLGGYIATVSATHLSHIPLNFQIHDALDGQLNIHALDKAHEVLYAMTNWPDIIPNLVVDMQAGENWQDMKKVVNIDEWVASCGKAGYANR
jgi:DNA polymerase I-like protein with 3'-5' exonuclease and polymerase domains